MSVVFTVDWDGAPDDWWGVAKFSLTNNTPAVLEDPLIEFTVATRQNVSKNSGLDIQRANGSNLVKGRVEDWVPNKIRPGQTVTFTVGVAPADGQPGVGPLPTNLKVNGQGGDGPKPPPGPTKPDNFRVVSSGVTASGSGSLTVAWDPSTSPVGIKQYDLSWNHQGGTPAGTPVTGTSHTIRGLQPDTYYRLAVFAVDNEDRDSEPATTGGTTGGGAPPPPTAYPSSAPFVDATFWPTPRLRKWYTQWGVKGFFLGFWTPATIDGSKRLTWGGYQRMTDKYEPQPDTACTPGAQESVSSVAAESPYLKWLIRDIQAQGGVVIPSVGGANGHPIEQEPDITIAEAVAEYMAALDNYGTEFIDFDIEGSALTTVEQQRKHVQVLNELRRQRPALKISHTFAIDVDGYNHHTKSLVEQMVAGGYQPDMVMGMLMEMRVVHNDYYQSLKAGAEWMAHYHSEKFGWSNSESWSRLGLCPMFGANNGVADDPRKVTTVEHMRKLVDLANEKGVATVSGWSANRDYNAHNPDQKCEDTQNCPPGPPYPSIYSCTHVEQEHAEFSKIAASYQGTKPRSLRASHVPPMSHAGADDGASVSAPAMRGYDRPEPMSRLYPLCDEENGDDMDMPGPIPPLPPDPYRDGLDVNVTVNVNLNTGGGGGGGRPLPYKQKRQHDWFRCEGHEKYSSDEWSYLDLNLCCRERKVADGYEYEITWDGAAQYYWGAAWYWDKYGGQFEWEIYEGTTLSASGKDSMSGQTIVHNDPIVVRYKERPSSLKLNYIKTGGYWETKGYPTSARIYDAIELPRSSQ